MEDLLVLEIVEIHDHPRPHIRWYGRPGRVIEHPDEVVPLRREPPGHFVAGLPPFHLHRGPRHGGHRPPRRATDARGGERSAQYVPRPHVRSDEGVGDDVAAARRERRPRTRRPSSRGGARSAAQHRCPAATPGGSSGRGRARRNSARSAGEAHDGHPVWTELERSPGHALIGAVPRSSSNPGRSPTVTVAVAASPSVSATSSTRAVWGPRTSASTCRQSSPPAPTADR